jgi:hypothetical protein
MNRRVVFSLAAVGFLAAATLLPRGSEPPAATAAMPEIVPGRLPPALADTVFARLIQRLSEAGGYFDTDNLISNESSYLHVAARLRQVTPNSGAYIGVGPDQNFSYMAIVRPRVAFILDIRRDNLLQHLWYKALFARAPTRIEYLALMFGRKPPRDASAWKQKSIGELVEYIDETPADAGEQESARRRVSDTLDSFGVALSAEDRATIARIHTTFQTSGLDLRYRSHGRAPRSSYPTYRQLLLESDRAGNQANYLVSEDGYAFLRDLEQRNLVVPVTGDFAGSHALREIGAWLREHEERVNVFYASNVEFYLMQDGSFRRFAENVGALPVDREGLIIRSLFGGIFQHPQTVAGYNSTQLLQKLGTFVDDARAGAYATYPDLVFRGFIDLR